MYRFAHTTCTRVVDGDTIHALIDFGFHLKMEVIVRLAGIDAPELSTPEGQAARNWLAQQIFAGTEFVMQTYKNRQTDKYGRFLAQLFMADGSCLNDAMLAAGHAAKKDY